MPSKPVDIVDPIVRRLRALAQDSPDLKDATQLYEAILPLLRDADLFAVPVSITRDQAHAKMAMGLPLLRGLDLELDGQAVCELMLQLALALERIGEKNRPQKRRLLWARAARELDAAMLPEGSDTIPRAETARRIRLALEENRLDVSVILQRIAANESSVVTALANSRQLDPRLVCTLAQNALKPALRAWSRQLTSLSEGVQWYKGYCFICGAGATLGELQENDQAKHLRCAQCGADWLFRRLQCLYCGNEDHNTLSYLYCESRHENMRVEVCEKCKGYLKVIAAFTPTPPELLAVEDLATLHLDYIAQERGYARTLTQY